MRSKRYRADRDTVWITVECEDNEVVITWGEQGETISAQIL